MAESVLREPIVRQGIMPTWVGRGILGNVEGLAGSFVLVVLVAAAIVGRIAPPYNPAAVNLSAQLLAPSSAHWFGTDELGRDVFSRVLAGASSTIPAALTVVAVSVLLGCSIGILSGYIGGRVDNVVMRITDLFLGYPAFLLAIAVVSSLGPGLWQAVLALSLLWWAGYARLARGQVRACRHLPYVEAADALGAGHLRVLLRHIMPNTLGPISVKASIDVSLVVESIAALGFIGLGAQPPSPEWGALIAESRNYALSAWWYPVFPGLALLSTVIAFNLLGDGLRGRRR